MNLDDTPLNGSNGHFTDLAAERSVVGTIESGVFDQIPENKLIPAWTFTDEFCGIIYGASHSLRRAGAPVCVGRVNALIELHRQDGALQKAIDPTKTIRWQDWPIHCDQSLGLGRSTAAVEFALETIGKLYEKREAHGVAKALEAGKLSPRDAIKKLEEIAPESRGLPPMELADDLCASPPLTPPEVVEGLLHQGSKLSLGGGSKAFKTWTFVHLACCVATGSEWLGFQTFKGKVLYVNFELPRFSMEKRLREVRKAMGIPNTDGNLTVWNLRGHATDAETILPMISREAKKQGFILIIIDPLYKLLGEREENATHHMTAIMNALERVAVETGAAVAFGTHYSKGNQSGKESMDRISGSGVHARDPDSIITMTAHKQPNAFSVDMTLRNFPPQDPFVVRREHPLMVVDGQLDPVDLKKPPGGRTAKHSANDLLACLDGSMTDAAWKDACKERGISSTTYYDLKKDLERAGKVFKSKLDQKWSLRG